MKRYIVLFGLFILFGFVVENKAVADCPPNWYSASFIADVDGCLYLIMYCYKCGVTGPDPGNLRITFYGRLPYDQQPNPGNCPDEPNLEALKDAILEKTRQHWMQQCEFPPCDPPGNMLNIVVEYPLCVRSINTAWTDQYGIRRHFVEIQSCGMNYYCQYISVCCRDYSIPPPNVNCNRCVQVQPQGDPMSCSQQPPEIPPPDSLGMTVGKQNVILVTRANVPNDLNKMIIYPGIPMNSGDKKCKV